MGYDLILFNPRAIKYQGQSPYSIWIFKIYQLGKEAINMILGQSSHKS